MKYLRTKYANLVKAETSETYFLRATVHGAKVFRSLRTRSIEIAVLKRDKELQKERARPHKSKRHEDWTLEQFIDEWLTGIQSSDRKDCTKESLRYAKFELNKAAPDALQTLARNCTEVKVGEWLAKVKARYCAMNWNKVLCCLKASLKIAVECGVLADNPAAGIRSQPVVIREKILPTPGQIQLLLAELERVATQNIRGFPSKSYWLARFLLYSGFRIRTVRLLTPANMDREHALFLIPGEWLKTGEPGRIYRFPILPQMAALLDEMDARFGKSRERLLPIRSAWATLRKTCDRLGIPRMTHHAFRHYFTSAAIASGVPVPVVAQWRGDRDGGKTLLRVYWHLIDETSRKFAEQVKLP